MQEMILSSLMRRTNLLVSNLLTSLGRSLNGRQSKYPTVNSTKKGTGVVEENHTGASFVAKNGKQAVLARSERILISEKVVIGSYANHVLSSKSEPKQSRLSLYIVDNSWKLEGRGAYPQGSDILRDPTDQVNLLLSNELVDLRKNEEEMKSMKHGHTHLQRAHCHFHVPTVYISDEPFFLTAKAGEDYVNGRGDDSLLPKRTTFVGSVIKDAGDKLDARVGSRVTKAAEDSGGTIVSDGCRSTSKDACLNVLFETSAGTQFISSIAATEVKKDMKYIARHIIDHIKKIGAANVTAVIMDGACVGAFKYITAKFKHVHCFICPTHSLDNFIKNICSDKPTITVKGHENCPQATFLWGENLFSKALQRFKTVVKAVTRYQKTLDIYRRLKKEANAHLESDAEQYKDLIKYCDTRFMSQLLMTIRYSKSLLILERLLLDGSFNSWLSGESRQTKEKVKSMV